jgi:perosamine synthetase
VATVSAIIHAGAKPVLVDVREDYNMDPAKLEAAITPRTRAIMPVDLYGHPAQIEELREIADRHRLLLIEDACQAHGAAIGNRKAGGFGLTATFSFYPTKNMTTAEGGAVASPDPDLVAGARRFRSHGMIRDKALLRHPDEGGWHQEVHRLGLNYRLPDVLCALGLAQLRRLDAFIKRRAQLVARYHELLGDVDGVALPPQAPDVEPAWHLFAARILDGRRREVYDKMHAAGIGVQVNYIPVHWHPVFEDMGYKRGMCPNAEQFYREELSLPLFPDLTDADQDRVVEALRTALR